jgi:hypothetical protein
VSTPSQPERDRLLVCEIQAQARHHAPRRELTADEHAAAVAALRDLAAGRADLLAEVAGLTEGFAEGQPDEALMRKAAELCRAAGADEALIPSWIEEGRRRWAGVGRAPFGAPRRIRPGQHPPGRGG